MFSSNLKWDKYSQDDGYVSSKKDSQVDQNEQLEGGAFIKGGSATFMQNEDRVNTIESLKSLCDTYNLKKGISSSCEQTYAYMLKLSAIRDDPVPFKSFDKRIIMQSSFIDTSHQQQ